MTDLISAATENNRLRIKNASLKAEVERLRADLAIQDSEHDVLNAQIDGLSATIQRVRDLHAKIEGRASYEGVIWCGHDGLDFPWPCPTIRALDGES